MRKKRISALVIAALMMISVIPQVAFGAADLNNIEWANFRNSSDNNGVTDRETPINYNETSLKWAQQTAPNYTDSCTPPLILDGFLYTAQGRYVFKLDKETGKKVATSVMLEGRLGYAMNPILYAEGMVFVQIDNGRVQALDAKTLQSVWISESVGGQTLSPITYKDGYLFTGTWNSEEKDGTFFCLSTKDEDPNQGLETKKCEWKFIPSQKGEGARGFYWAGAYASDNYIAFGADDGTEEGKSSNSAVFYTVNPKTGAVIDKKTGLKGDIRTTTVYHGGHLYFASKGGSLYKVAVDDKTGKLGKLSSTNTKGMMTAAPVIYNGRIYIGVAGQGGQFNADGGHNMAVINDEETLTDGSLSYTVPIRGYPQAAALLSTAEENTDFNKDGKADHRVYLYFTYNSYPGGIYYLTDQPGQTSGKAVELFTPPKDKQQFCISTLCCDKEGSLYYKNDSGYMMAVARNRAYAENITVTADTGKIEWSDDFKTGGLDYELVAPTGTTKVKIQLKLPANMTAKIEDKNYTGAYTCALNEDGTKEIPITVSKTEGSKSYSRTYNLNIRGQGADASLSDLVLNTSNAYSSSQLTYDPAFDPMITEYMTPTLTANELEGRTYVNVWPQANEKKAKIQVYPVENVLNKGWDDDGTIDVAGQSGGHNRYAVYFIAGKTTAKIKIKVTSENKAASREYFVTLIRDPSVSSVTLTLNKKSASIYAKGVGNTVQLSAKLENSKEPIKWVSSNEKVAKVQSGKVTAVAAGKATITASVPGAHYDCVVTVKSPTLALSKYKATLYTYKTYKTTSLTATVNGVKKQKASWKVTQGTKYASVSSSGKITAKRSGKAIVTATVNGVKKTCTVTIKKPSFKLSKSSATIKKKKSTRIKVKAIVPKGKVTYKSANKRVATVTSKGVVKGKKKGSTYIKVTCNGVTKKFKVRVK